MMASKHVMLSYQWDDQKLVTDVYNYLTEKMQMKVWMDIHGGMKANIYECMAEGVQGAEVIVCFLTPKYQSSPNCQQELQFARDSKVAIVPCRVQSSWKPSDWLGFITAGSLLIDFRNVTTENFPSKMEELMKQINCNTGKSLAPAESENETRSSCEKAVAPSMPSTDNKRHNMQLPSIQIQPVFNNSSLANWNAFSTQHTCPDCHEQIKTQTKKKNGLPVWLMCCGISMVGGIFGCCLIPFCIDAIKDTEHYCPRCSALIGMHKHF